MLRLLPEYVLDALEYARESKTFVLTSKEAERASLLELSHSIEKGFSLRFPRNPFGKEKAQRLRDAIDRYQIKHGADEYSHIAMAIVKEHSDFTANSIGIDKIESSVRQIVSRKPIHQASDELRELIGGRRSTRQFRSKAPDIESVRRAIETAMSAPSSCNRQSTVVHYFDSRADIAKVLSVQGGAAPFADEVPALVVVTTRLAAWDSPNERLQGMVDGGMFAMNLLLALEVEGFVSCPLNLAMVHQKLKQLRRTSRIPADERPVVAIAFGYPENEYRVARSLRRNVEDVLVCHR